MARKKRTVVNTNRQMTSFGHPRRQDDTDRCTAIETVFAVNKKFVFMAILYPEFHAFVALIAKHLCNLYAT
jgi:hypothetical protein